MGFESPWWASPSSVWRFSYQAASSLLEGIVGRRQQVRTAGGLRGQRFEGARHGGCRGWSAPAWQLRRAGGGLPFGRWRGASSLRMDWLALALHRASLPLGAVVGGSLQVVVMCRL